MFGSHLSIAGSMVNALLEAEKLGMDTVQVFTKNQQQWKAKPLDPAMVKDWHTEMKRLGWQGRIVSHASYLINLASCNEELWRKSVDLMTDEIERCEALGIACLVHHPGSHVGTDLETGLASIARAYKELFSRTRGAKVVSCFEGTVGAGNLIGGPFEHLARLRSMAAESTGEPDRLGFCLDTCHMHSFGYDMSGAASARQALDEFDRLCGLSALRVWHVNDSKAAAGSRRDLHEHLGKGTIGGTPERLGESGFSVVVNLAASGGVPKILETPKDDAEGEPWDAVNLRRLRSLLPGAAPAVAPASPAPGLARAGRRADKPGPVTVRKKQRAGKASRKPAQERPRSGKPRRAARKGRR